MREEKIYHIWLIPEDGDIFKSAIKQLSETYKSKLFDPHVTLVSGITGNQDELVGRTENLARALSKMVLQPMEFSYTREFYRALFIVIKSSHELSDANLLAKNIFNLSLDQDFMPHLSLFYGELPSEEKEKIKKQLSNDLLLPFVVGSLVLFCTDMQSCDWFSVANFTLQ